MADYLTTDTELTSIANAIRLKGGTSEALTYPQDFITAINNIETGGGGEDGDNLYYGNRDSNKVSLGQIDYCIL